MRSVTFRQLQIFAEAARTLSFARVAERLHLTPAAVSFQVKQLETISGFALFERMPKKLVLTYAGETLLAHATIVLETLHDADETLTALKGLAGGRVTVGLVSTAKYFVPHLLARFQSSHPAIQLHVREGNRREIIDVLVKGEVDLAVMGQPPDGVAVVAERFAPHPSVIIAPPHHRLAAAPGMALNLLAGESFIVREQGSGTRSLMDRCFIEQRFSPRIVMSSSSNETIKQAVMAGMGIALISQHTIGLELGLGLLRMLEVDGFPLMRSWYVAHRPHTPQLPAHARLKSFLLDHGQGEIERLIQGYATIAQTLRAKPVDARPPAGTSATAAS